VNGNAAMRKDLVNLPAGPPPEPRFGVVHEPQSLVSPPYPPLAPEHVAVIRAAFGRIKSWVNWKWLQNPKDAHKPFTKPPVSPATGKRIDAHNAQEWKPLEIALGAAQQYRRGLGFSAGPIGSPIGIVIFDFDNCIGGGGQVNPQVLSLVRRLDSYTEITPSGKGLRVLCWGTKPGPGCVKKEPFEIEIYDQGRYVTVSGILFWDGHQAWRTIENRQVEVDAICAELWPAPADQRGVWPATAEPPRLPEPPGASANQEREGDGPQSSSVEGRAIAYLDKVDPAVSGQRGHNTCFRAACDIVRFGIDNPDDVFRILWARYNDKCDPPWTEEEVRHKAKDACTREQRRDLAEQGHDTKPTSKAQPGHSYSERAGCTYAGEKKLADFTARIEREVLRHEAGEVRRCFEIKAVHRDQSVVEAAIPASDFAEMAWVPAKLGSKFSICSGRGTKDMLREAIQLVSHDPGTVQYAEVYTALGWHQIAGQQVYLHAGGGIGAGGPVAVEIDMERSPLARYRLPAPDRAQLGTAVERVLCAYETLGGGPVAAVLVSLPWRAILGPSRFAIHFAGSTGTFKTSAAVLAARFFAPGLEHSDPAPANWGGTADSLQWPLYTAGDAVLLVDNLVADGDQAAKELYKADQIFNSVGDLTGRRRMRADGLLAPTLDPRTTVISTGECDPSRRSALGRILIFMSHWPRSVGFLDDGERLPDERVEHHFPRNRAPLRLGACIATEPLWYTLRGPTRSA
jgi:hypothetical protein